MCGGKNNLAESILQVLLGNLSQNSAAVGGGAGFQGGTFVFSSATPFSSFTLNAFNVAGAPVNLAIDNLTLTTPTYYSGTSNDAAARQRFGRNCRQSAQAAQGGLVKKKQLQERRRASFGGWPFFLGFWPRRKLQIRCATLLSV